MESNDDLFLQQLSQGTCLLKVYNLCRPTNKQHFALLLEVQLYPKMNIQIARKLTSDLLNQNLLGPKLKCFISTGHLLHARSDAFLLKCLFFFPLILAFFKIMLNVKYPRITARASCGLRLGDHGFSVDLQIEKL